MVGSSRSADVRRAEVVDRLRRAGCVFAEEEADLLIADSATPEQLSAAVERRVHGLPLEQVLGWAAFCGLRVAVAPGVFVPRRRSEFLVAEAIARTPPAAVVVDLCCGTAAVGVAVAATATDVAAMYAVDVDPAAVVCARANTQGLPGQVFLGDLYEPLPDDLRGRVDVLTANAPYVPTDAIALLPPEARLHEPRVALDGGGDGLAIQRRVAAAAGQWLSPGGHLLIETGQHQAAATAEIVTGSGLAAQVVHDADLDATVVIGTRLAGAA